jgi:RNA polymerase sigma factor (TIGR02999 family)
MSGLGAAANPTTLLLAWGRGDETALDQLIPLVHDELRRLARRHMAGERSGHTLQATALVNEAYLRLTEVNQVRWQNRAHFFAMASRVMRRILVDAARALGIRNGAPAPRGYRWTKRSSSQPSPVRTSWRSTMP